MTERQTLPIGIRTDMLERFICVSGINPAPQVITNFSKNSSYL